MAVSSGRDSRNSSEKMCPRSVSQPVSPASPVHLQPQQLLAVVPLVERAGLVDPLVALQPDQPGAGRRRHRLGQLGLADPGRPLDQQRLAQPVGQEDGRRGRVVGEVAGGAEPLADLGRRREEGGLHTSIVPHRVPDGSGQSRRGSRGAASVGCPRDVAAGRARPGGGRAAPRPAAPRAWRSASCVAAVAGLLALAGGRPVPPGRSAYDAGTTDPVAAAVPVLAGFAEQARELRFRAPPRVEVVDAAAFARVRAEPLPAPPREPGDRASTTRALGLAAGGGRRDAAGALQLPPAHGLRPPRRRPSTRTRGWSLVRELTRALQDQSFDVLRLAAGRRGADADRARALAALVEGDATRVEAAYVATLPAGRPGRGAGAAGSPRPALVRRAGAQPSRRPSATTSRPRWPSTGATRRWTAAFARPPVSTAQVIDPREYLAGVEPLGRAAAAGRGAAGRRRARSASSGWRRWSPAAAGCSTSAPPASGWATATAPSGRPAGCARTATSILADTAARDQLLRDLAGWVATRRGRAEVARSAERGLRLRSCA